MATWAVEFLQSIVILNKFQSTESLRTEWLDRRRARDDPRNHSGSTILRGQIRTDVTLLVAWISSVTWLLLSYFLLLEDRHPDPCGNPANGAAASRASACKANTSSA